MHIVTYTYIYDKEENKTREYNYTLTNCQNYGIHY